MTKRKYTATFADGTVITRATDRIYGAAWRATWTSTDGKKRSVTGFAANRECANPYRPAVYYVFRGMPAAKRRANQRANAAYLSEAGYAVEFAQAVLA